MIILKGMITIYIHYTYYNYNYTITIINNNNMCIYFTLINYELMTIHFKYL